MKPATEKSYWEALLPIFILFVRVVLLTQEKKKRIPGIVTNERQLKMKCMIKERQEVYNRFKFTCFFREVLFILPGRHLCLGIHTCLSLSFWFVFFQYVLNQWSISGTSFIDIFRIFHTTEI